jgi:hypothetical protein
MPEMGSSDNDGMRPTAGSQQVSPKRLADLGGLGPCDHLRVTANLADHTARGGGCCATRTNRLTLYRIHQVAPLSGTFWRIVFRRLAQRRRLAHRGRRNSEPAGEGEETALKQFCC